MSANNALIAQIELLKQQRNAVVVAHYYQSPEIQVNSF
jgi:quinolinate synthase